MPALGIDCRFEPVEPLKYSTAKLEKFIKAAQKGFPSCMAWDTVLQNLQLNSLVYSAPMRPLPLAGLLLAGINLKYWVQCDSQWRESVAQFLEVKPVRDEKLLLSLRLFRRGFLCDERYKAQVEPSRECTFDLKIDAPDKKGLRLEMAHDVSSLDKNWARQVLDSVVPGLEVQPNPANPAISALSRQGTEIGSWNGAAVTVDISRHSLAEVGDVLQRWSSAVKVPDEAELMSQVTARAQPKYADRSAEFSRIMAHPVKAQRAELSFQYAVLSPEGLESFRQWPKSTNGEEIDACVCVFERNGRERGAIAVVTNPEGHRIVFHSTQAKMQPELEKLFGLKLKKVKNPHR